MYSWKNVAVADTKSFIKFIRTMRLAHRPQFDLPDSQFYKEISFRETKLFIVL